MFFQRLNLLPLIVYANGSVSNILEIDHDLDIKSLATPGLLVS